MVESEEVVRGDSEASEHELLSAVSALGPPCPSNCPGDSATCPGILFSDPQVPGVHHCPSTINLQDLQ